MKRKKLISSCLFAVGLFALPQVFAQPENQLVRSSAIFEGKTRVRSVARNELHETNVRIQNVAIVGGQKLDSIGLRSDGIVIIQLRGGKITTIIDGKRQQRKEGEFWTVPAGARMTFETEDDTATIQTIEISRS